MAPVYKCPFVSPFFGAQQTRTGGDILTCGEINGPKADHECAYYNESSEQCRIREFIIQGQALMIHQETFLTQAEDTMTQVQAFLTEMETVLPQFQETMENANDFFDSQS